MSNEEIIARWKSTLADECPAGSIEVDDLDDYLGSSPICSACSGCTTTICCSSGCCHT